VSDSAVVTFLFTDLVGSTEMLDRLGDDVAEQVRRTHFRLLRDAVTGAGGEEVKNLGDGLMVAFASALAAVRCATAMQQTVARHNAGEREAVLDVRIGLHVGEPIRGEDDYFGTSVVVAKRLCDRAQGGQIVASDLLRGLVGSRGAFEFTSLEALELKGFSEPVSAFEVAWRAPDRTETVRPLPPGLDQPSLAGYVGRTSERDELMKTWKAAVAGAMKLVMVAGEPGVGKTRLVAEVARSVHDDGAVVLFGRCTEEALMPYQPFVEALRDHAAASSTMELADETRVGASQLARFVPDLGARLSVSDPDLRADPQSERFLLFEAVGAWFDAIGARTPVLLVLDDLHWADSSTLQLLAFLARRHGEHHLLMLGTYRETDLARTHPLAETLADLRRERLVERVSLHGLDAETVAALIGAIGGQTPPADFAALVYAETEGNPFFVEEVLVHLAESGALQQENDEWRLTRPLDQLGVPEGVREVVGRRLNRLGATANRALSVGAIVGREFDLDVVARVADLSADELLDILDQCVAVRIVVEAPSIPGRFGFSHALIRQTLYEELGATRRVVFHERVGRAIETLRAGRLDDQLGALAHHFLEAAAVGGVKTAVDYTTRAAQQAVARCAYAEAAELLGRARQTVELLSPDDDNTLAELWLGIGDALGLSGAFPLGADAYLEAANCARRAHAAGVLARAALGCQIAMSVAGRSNPQTIALAEEAIAALGDTEPALRARALTALARELEWTDQIERRRAVAGEAMMLARESGEPTAVVIAAFAYANERYFAGDADESAAVYREAVRAAEQAGDGSYLGSALGFLVAMTLAAGNVDEYEEVLARHAQVAETLRIPIRRWFAVTIRAGRLLMGGELTATETALDDVLALTDPTDPTQLVVYGAQLIALRTEQERAGEIVDLVRDAVDQNPGLPALRIALARIYLQLGEIDEARAHYLPLLTDVTRTIPNDGNQTIAIAQLADICDTIDDDPTDGALTEWLTPRANQYILVGIAQDCWGSVQRSLGTLARVARRLDDAETHLEQALIANQRLGSARWVTRTQYDLARVLLQHDRPGDRDRAADLVRTARPVAEQHGLRHTLALLDSLDLDLP
jgi:class 3 adenylate cyclase/tetratricopeptide (TPR) repeat protein